MGLSDTQIRFVEAYILRGRLPDNVRSAGLAPASSRETRVADTSRILEMARALEVPEGASPEERTGIVDLRRALAGLLDDSPTDAELRAAARVLLDLQTAHQASEAAIAQRAQDRYRRETERAEVVGDLHAALETFDTDVPEDDRAPLVQGAIAAEDTLPGTPSDADLGTARQALATLKAGIAAANVRAAKARAEAAEKIRSAADESFATLPPDVPGEERTRLEGLLKALKSGLPETPSTTELGAATLALDGLKEAVRLAVEAAQADRKIRETRAARMAQEALAVTVAHASPDEAKALSGLARSVGEALPPPPYFEDFTAAEQAMEALREEAARIGADVAKRLERVEQAKTLLARIAWGTEPLKVHDRASAVKTDALKDRARILREDVDALTDPDASHSWGADDLTALEERLAALATDIEQLNAETAALMRSVKLLEGRIARVKHAPANALPSELAALTSARKAAQDGVGKVDA